MSNLTEEQLRRIREIRWAAAGQKFETFQGLGRADVKLLADRLGELDFVEHTSADEMLRWLLERLKEDRKSQREWLADLIDQIRIAELQAMEADRAVMEVEALLAGSLYVHGDEINKRWDAVSEEYRRRGLFPADVAPEPPPAVEAPTPPPEPVAVAVAVVPEPPPPEPPVVAQQAPDPKPPSLGALIMEALDEMVAAHGADLDAPKVAEFLGETADRARVALKVLAAENRLQYVKRRDRAQRTVLRIGEEPPATTLTDNQSKVFDAIAQAADAAWRAKISRGRLSTTTGIKAGSLDQILWSLELKDHIRVIERGNSKTPSTFLICEAHRPERAAPPKTDEELIAEALAAGRVTTCPGPGAGLH